MIFRGFFLLLLCFFLNSCSSVQSLYNNANSKKKYNSREIYLQELLSFSKYARNKVFFLSDSELKLLMNDVVSKKLSTYYGIIKGNCFVSADQLSVKSCQGQISTLYYQFKRKDEAFISSKASTIGFLKNLNLEPGRQTIVFLYSYKLGRLSKSKIESVINELQSDNNFDYRIISLDNGDIKY